MGLNDVVLAIGWDLKKVEYFHADILEYVNKKYGSSSACLGGGKIIYKDSAYNMTEKSQEYGKMDIAHVALYSKSMGMEMSYPYTKNILA